MIDIPNNAPTKIQKAAPGPPIEIEIATPAILPIPIVPDRAVARAWNDETSPQLSPSDFLVTLSMACFNPHTAIPFKYIVKKIPAARIHKMITGTFAPQIEIGKKMQNNWGSCLAFFTCYGIIKLFKY